jgi:hypothetical protein
MGVITFRLRKYRSGVTRSDLHAPPQLVACLACLIVRRGTPAGSALMTTDGRLRGRRPARRRISDSTPRRRDARTDPTRLSTGSSRSWSGHPAAVRTQLKTIHVRAGRPRTSTGEPSRCGCTWSRTGRSGRASSPSASSLDASTVSRRVATLVKLGYAQRLPTRRRRAVQLAATDAGPRGVRPRSAPAARRPCTRSWPPGTPDVAASCGCCPGSTTTWTPTARCSPGRRRPTRSPRSRHAARSPRHPDAPATTP